MNRLIKCWYDAAKKLHLHCSVVSDANFLKLTLGKVSFYILGTLHPINNASSIYIATHKSIMNKLLSEKGFPVPKALSITYEQWRSTPLSELIKGLNFPLVAKPMQDTSRGTDVLCNIKDLTVLSDYFNRMAAKHLIIQIEEFKTGLNEYRVAILKNKVVGVLERRGAFITGDGIHTIDELIKIRNRSLELFKKINPHEPLVYDEECKICLEEQGVMLQTIPPKGKKIRLAYTANLGRGGDIFSLGTDIHPQNKRTLCDVLNQVGLDFCGFDVLCDNIQQPFTDGRWFLIEANASADITMHADPSHGKRTSIAEDLLIEIIRRHPFAYLYQIGVRKYYKTCIKILALGGLILFVKVIFGSQTIMVL